MKTRPFEELLEDDRSYLFRREGELKRALLKLGAAASSDGQLHFEHVARQTAAFDAVGYITSAPVNGADEARALDV